MTSSSQSNIMTIDQLINAAFDDYLTNVVHHKKIEAILYILAGNLKLLGRKFDINVDKLQESESSPESSLSVTEVKVHVTEYNEQQTETQVTEGKNVEKDKIPLITQEQYILNKNQRGLQKKEQPATTQDKDQNLKKTEQQTKQKIEQQKLQQRKEQQTNESSLKKRNSLLGVSSGKSSRGSGESAYEKILVVERVPSDKSKNRSEASSGRQAVRVPGRMVPQEQYEELAYKVCELQEIFSTALSPLKPNDAEIVKQMHRETALSDGMAGMQISARLEMVEKMINEIFALLTILTTEVEINGNSPSAVDIKLLFEEPKTRVRTQMDEKRDLSKLTKGRKGHVSESTVSVDLTPPPEEALVTEVATGPDEDEAVKDRVTENELETATRALYDEIMKTVTSATTHCSIDAKNALTLATKIDKQLNTSFNIGDTMEKLEEFVQKYADKINYIDTILSKEMSAYQEELSQMQRDVEVGIETMAESLGTLGCDPALIIELNEKFNELQSELCSRSDRQKELNKSQNNLATDLKSLWEQIEGLSNYKASRDDVEAALRDKVGIGALNGLISLQQFGAVKGEMEKHIAESYDMFNNQEIVWQRHLNDCEKQLNDKVSNVQLNDLYGQIYQHTERLKGQIKYITDILGEPYETKLTRSIHQEGPCISCSNPANIMEGKEPIEGHLKSERPPAIGAEAEKSKIGGDHDGKCFAGNPIPHPIDPRSEVCRRWCGGSHTKISNTIPRAPPGVLITSLPRRLNKEIGVDGKLYAVDEANKPCSQCYLSPVGY